MTIPIELPRGVAPVLLLLLGLLAASACGPSDPVAEATRLLQEEKVEAALAVLRDAVERSPTDPAVNHLYGQVLIANGQASLASWPLRSAADHPEWAVQSGLLLAQSLLVTRNHHEAVRAADAVLAHEPDNLRAVRIRADARIGAQRPGEALEDLDRLIEAFPDELSHREKKLNILLEQKRLDEAEALLVGLREVVDERDDLPPSAPGLLCAKEVGLDLRRKNLEAAGRRIEGCLERHPDHHLVIRQAVEYFDEVGDPERATAILEAGSEALPNDAELLGQLANRLVERRGVAHATRELRAAAERRDTPLTWMALRNHAVRYDDMVSALEATDRMLGSLAGHAPGDPDFPYDRVPEERLFEAALVVAMAGDFERARAMGEHIEETSHAHLLDARIHFERDEPAEALAAWEEAFRLFPSNPGARHLAGLTALRLGRVDTAIEHLRNAVRTRSPESGSAIVLGKVYLAMGHPGAALDAISYHLVERPADVDALILQARIAGQLGREESEHSLLALLFAIEPGKAVATRARTLQGLRGSEFALTYLSEGIAIDLDDPAHVDALAAWVEQMVNLGRGEEALARVARVSAAHPGNADLLALHGAALSVLEQSDAARASLERALALDADHHQAHVALARVAAHEGDVDGAVAHFQRAAELEADDPTPIYEAVEALRAAGRDDEAHELLTALLRENPWEGLAAHLLADAALAAGETDARALSLAERAAVFHADPGHAAFETLGRIRLARGEVDRAVVALRRAAAMGAGGPSGLYRIGSALSEAGDVEGAIRTLEGALESGSFPEAEQARKALAALQTPG